MFPIHSRKSKSFGMAAGFLALVFLVISLVAAWEVQAKPTSTTQAQQVVEHWLALDGKPLGCALGYQVREVQPFTDHAGRPLYFIVYLNPTGFVIVSGDDLVEPIIGFLSHGRYDPSPANPLGALVSRDIPGRVAQVRQLEEMARKEGLEAVPLKSFQPAKRKWERLLAAAPAALPGLGMGLPSVSDICVAPLVQSKWAQGNEGSDYCYNYYTPQHYPCGCVATAMAQLMRYWQWPETGVGDVSRVIWWYDSSWVKHQETRKLRGGDGAGGAYDWANMVLDPDASTTDIERQAIGALTYDAGLSVCMTYGPDESSADLQYAADNFTGVFHYENAISMKSAATIPRANLYNMVNPNLDAGNPVLLGIGWLTVSGGHALVGDGYGYNLATLYHHLNLGWAGAHDAWYNLPIVDTSHHFDALYTCIYNVYPSGSGEIISGRVLDYNRNPVVKAKVTATITGGDTYSTTTNDRGIFFFAKVPSATEYTVYCDTYLYGSRTRVVRTGTSTNGSIDPGNVWGINMGPWKWTFKMGGAVQSSPAIGPDGTVYIGSMDSYLYAIDANGVQKWAFKTGSGIHSSPAVGPDGTIYVGSFDTFLYAVNPDGTPKWACPTNSTIWSSPGLAADGTVYVGSSDGKLYAINPQGTEKWSFPTSGGISSSPAIGPDRTIYVGSGDRRLYALNPDGTKKWDFLTGSTVISTPAIGADGVIYVGSYDNKLYAVNPDGSRKWEFPTGDAVHSSPAIGPDGTIYVGSLDRRLYAINPGSTKKWEFNTGSGIESSPAIGVDGTIYVGTYDNKLYAINSGGAKKWAFSTGDNVGSSPAIGPDGTIYVGSHDGNLYAISDPCGGLARSPWPMFHHDLQHTGRVPSSVIPAIQLLLGD